jgi:hypothetical protein
VSNFTSFTLERVHLQRHQVYKEKKFEIKSLTHLIEEAKTKACEKLDWDPENPPELRPLKLPFRDLTQHLMESLQLMHHLLGNILMLKLSQDARHVITAERSRVKGKSLFEGLKKADVIFSDDKMAVHNIPEHLSEIGRDSSAHDLELLNEYRETFAHMMAELLIAKEVLTDFEKQMRNETQDEGLRNQALEDLDELGDLEAEFGGGQWGRRRSSEW